MNRNVKDTLVALAILIPVIGLIAGGIMYLNGNFDGTFMKELYPAIFLALCGGGILFNLCLPYHEKLVYLLSVLAFVSILVLWLWVSKLVVAFVLLGIGLFVGLTNTIIAIAHKFKRK